ncbi:hypothetical protein NQ318_019459 [Aromia moschata]|uniref:Uncharacterized protein n=1 Tax=Aromia moschata TaxID=1265417 RepID=A0AAV8YAE4_9CUCU|nr:hypothetical protein NQ318_019459 [Aromia moschata]
MSTRSKKDEGVEELINRYNKRNTLRFTGCTERGAENIADLILDIINNNLNVSCDKYEIDAAFQIGKTNLTKQRYDLLQAAKKKLGKNRAWSTAGKIYVLDAESNKKRYVESLNEL